MMPDNSFSERIELARIANKSNIILAIDPMFGKDDLFEYILDLINNLGKYLCAIKLNFHVILPLSADELRKLNLSAHNANLQIIADIKLNDIPNTNQVAIQYLSSMGFDSVIVNPFIGRNGLKTAVDFAHSINFGVISLIYMSHNGAEEGYGALVDNRMDIDRVSKYSQFYDIFYENSVFADVDGFIIGANRLDIIKKFSSKKKINIPIYSPGVITQGGEIKPALDSGSDFLIIGRAIVNADDPFRELQRIHKSIKDDNI
jgi:orotidine-5'-phosphate decarboxylase